MRKIFVIARREYLAAVKTKGFLISLVLLPVMMSIGVIGQQLGKKFSDVSMRRVAIIDRSPGEAVFDVIQARVKTYNAAEIFDGEHRTVRSPFTVEKISPADASDLEKVNEQLLELSDRVRSGQLLAFVEIGDDMLEPATSGAPSTATPSTNSAAPDMSRLIQYTTNRPTYRDFYQLLSGAVRPIVVKSRLRLAEITDQQLQLAEPRITDRGLASRENGEVSFASRSGQIAPFIVPIALLMLMFIVILVGVSPMTTNVIEEKQLRIAEVLLGSARPFELMLGKLLGGVAVALTLAAIYFGGAYYIAYTQGVAGYVTTGIIAWFIFFTIIGTLMYGSMFVAAGAAVTNIKESQTLMMPVMLMIVLPLSLIGPMMQDPNGSLALAGSFFPISAPMIMTARLAIAPGPPVWQSILSATITIAAMLGLVWCAGRIFRVGILMQGQGASIGQLLKWIVCG